MSVLLIVLVWRFGPDWPALFDGDVISMVVPATPIPEFKEDKISVPVYFPSRDWSRLELYSREIPDRRVSLPEWVGLLLTALSDPPSDHVLAVVPAGIKVKNVLLDEQQVLYVDLPEETATFARGGVEKEMLILQSMVQTLGRNVSGVNRVKFLIEGKERETFAGHIELRQPFRP